MYDFPRTFPMDLPMSFQPDAHGGAHAHGPLRDAQPREFQGRAGLDPKGCMNGRMKFNIGPRITRNSDIRNMSKTFLGHEK